MFEGEGEEERRDNASVMTKGMQYKMGLLLVPLQMSRKAAKPARCFVRIGLFCVKTSERAQLKYGWAWGKER